MSEYNTSRREMLKTTGTIIAGITGTTALMPGTAAAAKSHYIKIVAESGTSSYYIELSDPNPVIESKEPNDNIDKHPNSSEVSGVVDATFSPKYDKVLFDGPYYHIDKDAGNGDHGRIEVYDGLTMTW